MTLIDTSSWVHHLRRLGDPVVRTRVQHLLLTGKAAWCAPVRLELWVGSGPTDRAILRTYETILPQLEITRDIWDDACALAARCRASGKTVPANDMLILACARHHSVELEHADAHFPLLMQV